MKIHLFCFNKQTLQERVAHLNALRRQVDFRAPDGPGFFKKLKQNPPDIFVIDLSRTPSLGRDIGVYLRKAKPTRTVPLVFVAGEGEKVEGVRALLPDASYTSWEKIDEAIVTAMQNAPTRPHVPDSAMAGYSSAPLMKKLGIKEGAVVGLVNAPENIRDILGPLPAGVKLESSAEANCSLFLWFLHSLSDLERDVPRMTDAAEHGPIWMIWAKKSSPLVADVTQQFVRDRGLAAGLVDYKVCAVDKDWTGLLFTKRKK